MKIIFLEAVQNYGGARMSTVELASRLSAKHDILIVDLYGSCLPFVESVKQRGIKFQIVHKRDKPYLVNGTSNFIKRLINYLLIIPHWIKVSRKLNTVIDEFKPDQVNLNNSKVLFFLFPVFRKSYKIILYARGWFLPNQLTFVDKFLYKYFVDRIICVSQATKHAIYAGELATMENIFVVYDGIDREELPKSIAEIQKKTDDIVLLHSGGFLPDKGIHISIEIARELKKKKFGFKLLITGLIYEGAISEKYYAEIVSLINSYSLLEEVSLVVNSTNIIPYFHAADILIHPSSTEGLPRVILEAMILKKPVIANPVGGVTDCILHNHTGFLTQFNSISDYVNYIEILSVNKTLYNQIVEQAYLNVNNNFTKDRQLIDFERLVLKS